MPRNRFLAVATALAAMVAGLFVAFTASPAAAATPALNWRHFVGVGSNRCLDVDTHSNIIVQLWSCDSGDDESWGIQYVGTMYPNVSYYEIVNRRTGKCLTTAGTSNTSGAAVVVGDCSTALYPWWYFPSTTGPTTPIVNVYSGLSLDARNGGTGNGTIVQLWGGNGTSAQSWRDAAI